MGTRDKSLSNKTITIQGADENAQLKRKWGVKTMLIKANAGANMTFKDITWSGSTVDAGSSFEASTNTSVMNFENVKFIEINQNTNYTIDEKSNGTVNINGLIAEGTYAMNGDAGWTVREGSSNKVNISGTNKFNIYVQNDYLLPVSNIENSDIIVGFNITNTNRLSSRRAIVRGCGDPSQIKSGPLAITCDGEAVENDEFLFADGTYNFTVANVGAGIEYSYKFTESAAQTFAAEGFTTFDPATGITVDKEGTLEITVECATMGNPNTLTRSITISKTTGIDGIVAEENAPVEYYNLQGIRVENPANGIFIRRQGNKTTKVAL